MKSVVRLDIKQHSKYKSRYNIKNINNIKSTLGRIDLTLLCCLPIQEHSMSFHLFRSVDFFHQHFVVFSVQSLYMLCQIYAYVFLLSFFFQNKNCCQLLTAHVQKCSYLLVPSDLAKLILDFCRFLGNFCVGMSCSQFLILGWQWGSTQSFIIKYVMLA